MMPVAVKQIYMDARLGHESNEKPALCVRGTKHAHCVVIDYPVRVVKRPAKDFDTCRDTPFKEGAYPVARMVAHLQKAGRRNGITVAAQRLLALAGQADQALSDEDLPTDEENEMTTETDAGQGAAETQAAKATPAKQRSHKKKEGSSKKAAPKGNPKAKATAKTAKPKATKKAAAEGDDGLGRVGTVGRTIREALLAGATNEKAVERARKEHPDKKIPDNYGAWYRNDLTKKGLLKAAK